MLGDLLGRGGNASVWAATRDGWKTTVAVKVINTTKVEREPYQRFVREIGFHREHQSLNSTSHREAPRQVHRDEQADRHRLVRVERELRVQVADMAKRPALAVGPLPLERVVGPFMADHNREVAPGARVLGANR